MRRKQVMCALRRCRPAASPNAAEPIDEASEVVALNLEIVPSFLAVAQMLGRGVEFEMAAIGSGDRRQFARALAPPDGNRREKDFGAPLEFLFRLQHGGDGEPLGIHQLDSHRRRFGKRAPLTVAPIGRAGIFLEMTGQSCKKHGADARERSVLPVKKRDVQYIYINI